MATDTRSVAVWLCGAFAKRSNLIRTLEDRLGWERGYVMLKDLATVRLVGIPESQITLKVSWRSRTVVLSPDLAYLADVFDPAVITTGYLS